MRERGELAPRRAAPHRPRVSFALGHVVSSPRPQAVFHSDRWIKGQIEYWRDGNGLKEEKKRRRVLVRHALFAPIYHPPITCIFLFESALADSDPVVRPTLTIIPPKFNGALAAPPPRPGLPDPPDPPDQPVAMASKSHTPHTAHHTPHIHVSSV